MSRTILVFFSALLGVVQAAAASAEAAPAAEASAAVAVAERSMAAMGGRDAFGEARLLRFDFAVVREGEAVARYAHWWDLHGGAYRLEGKDREGRPFRVLFGVDDREGEAWRDGSRLEGDEAEALLEMAHRRFVNDTYWLLMPWKWLDPGVRLAYQGAREVDGTTFDVVELRFEAGVGLTSGDRYWGFVSRESGLMERWEFVLQQEDGSPGEGPPAAWAWEGWRRTAAGTMLASVRRRLGDGPAVTIEFPIAELDKDLSEEELEAALRPAPETPVAIP